MNKKVIIDKVKSRIGRLHSEVKKHQTKELMSKQLVSHEIYTLISTLGPQNFVDDQGTLSQLVELQYFSLEVLKSSEKAAGNVKETVLCEVGGFFDLFIEMISTSEGSGTTPSQISPQNLLIGFREILNLLIRTRGTLKTSVAKSLIRAIHRFMVRLEFETDFHHSLYDVAIKFHRLKHFTSIRMTDLQQTNNQMKLVYSNELERIELIKRGLTEVLVKSYTPLDGQHVEGSISYNFVNRVILELFEEELKLGAEAGEQLPSPALRSETQPNFDGSNSNSNYRYAASLISEFCLTRSDPGLCGYVFKLIAQRLQISKLVANFCRTDKPSLKEFYLQLLTLQTTLACYSKSAELLNGLMSQICAVLTTSFKKETRVDCKQALDQMYSTMNKICSKDLSTLLVLYKSQILQYFKVRADQQPFSEAWVDVNRFLMLSTLSWSKMLSNDEKIQERLLEQSDATMKFWLGVIIDLDLLLERSEDEVQNFCEGFNTLIEGSERIYSNCFLASELLFQQALPTNLEDRLAKVIEKHFSAYKRYLQPVSLPQRMYLLAILLLIRSKINILKKNPRVLLNNQGQNGCLLRDILAYLNDHLLLENPLQPFRSQLENMLTDLANDYISSLVDIGDVQVQLELAHRDFIVLVQYCLSYTTPFAHMCRIYLIQYFKLFPPIFFKERVVETLCVCIDKIANRLNLSYSNINERVNFPYFNQAVMGLNTKAALRQALCLVISVLTNLYFSGYFLSRYLNLSVVENYLKSSVDYYAEESLGVTASTKPNSGGWLLCCSPGSGSDLVLEDNWFLLWMNKPRKFHQCLKYNTKRLAKFHQRSLVAYNKESSTLDLPELKTLLLKVAEGERNFLEHYVGALNFKEEFLNLRLKDLNITCMNLELCMILKKLPGKFEECFFQLVLLKETNPAVFKQKIDEIISNKEKKVFEELTFLQNLIRQNGNSDADYIDRLILILAMYGLPSVYQYFFTEFIPSLMRDTRGFNYDRMLIDVQKLLNKIVKQLGDLSLNFEEIYSTEQAHSSSIISLTSDLFRTVFTERQAIVGDGGMMPALIDNNYRTSKTITVTSASYCLNGLHALKMEGEWIKCVHHITTFLQKFMPVFFVKVNRLENIMNFFRTIFKMKYLAVRKIELSTFCGINLSFLQFWEILELRSLTSKDRYILELMTQLRKAYFRFCANHFSWTIFTRDCYKEYNHIDSMETVIQNLKCLYYIHAKIVTFKDDYGSARLIGNDASSIYNRTFTLTSKFDFVGNVIVKREESSFTLKKITGLLAYNSYQSNYKSVYLNIIPEDFLDPNSGGSKAPKYSSRKLQRIIGDMVADEIEKLKGFFYTKFKHNSKYPDLLGYDKIKEASFIDDIKTLFWENPQTALAYSLRLQTQVDKASPNMLANVFGPLIEQCVEVFIRYKDFLTHFVDYKASKYPNSPLEDVDAIMYWEMPYIPLVLKYIGQEYDRHEVLGNFFAKTMQRINSNQLSFYLSQIFQSLDYKTGDIIEDFMVSYSEKSPLFAHQVIWMARVEQKADSEKENKLNTSKRERASRLPLRIIKNMGLEEKKFWDEVDTFFEQITKISSILKPKMPKDEKKSIINSELHEIKMPPLVYMPTNPEYIVTSIKQGSGNPMQSAAKCPILVSFYCKKFEGPDKYFANLKAKRLARNQQRSPSRLMEDFDENIEPLAEKLNRSISVKGAFINREGIADTKHGENLQLLPQRSTKLNAFTEEMFPLNWETPAEGTTTGPDWGHVGRKKSAFHLRPLELGFANSPANKGSLSAFRTSEAKFNWNASQFSHSAKKYVDDGKTPDGMKVVEPGTNQIIKLGDNKDPLSGRLSKELTAAKTLQTQSGKEMMRQDTLQQNVQPPNQEDDQVVSCIFKTFDDIRRDNLSLQVIQIFQEIFNMEKLDLFLFPYKTISTRTGNEQTIGGIIEVVPNTMSRDQIGKENKYSLYDFFREKYGSELSTMFQQARENFVKSMAAYAIVSYILQIKDRHNGNILIDQQGHLIHIDFGFIFSISPGKNLGFENAQFKLTSEMIQIMGGNTKAEPYRMFVDNTIRAFLAVRKYKELIINIVELITKSTLGCFNEQSMARLRARFLEDMNDNQAAKHIKKMINHAFKNYRTYLYDKIQWLQQKIES